MPFICKKFQVFYEDLKEPRFSFHAFVACIDHVFKECFPILLRPSVFPEVLVSSLH